jgi:hypothetical protein
MQKLIIWGENKKLLKKDEVVIVSQMAQMLVRLMYSFFSLGGTRDLKLEPCAW